MEKSIMILKMLWRITMNDINEQNYIYFYSPGGTYTRINKNLKYLGLDKNKKVCNTYTRNFNWSVKENTYEKKYKKYDVIYLDEFYDYSIDYEICYKALEELVNEGKRIVMAGYGDLNSLVEMPEEMKKTNTIIRIKL